MWYSLLESRASINLTSCSGSNCWRCYKSNKPWANRSLCIHSKCIARIGWPRSGSNHLSYCILRMSLKYHNLNIQQYYIFDNYYQWGNNCWPRHILSTVWEIDSQYSQQERILDKYYQWGNNCWPHHILSTVWEIDSRHSQQERTLDMYFHLKSNCCARHILSTVWEIDSRHSQKECIFDMCLDQPQKSSLRLRYRLNIKQVRSNQCNLQASIAGIGLNHWGNSPNWYYKPHTDLKIGNQYIKVKNMQCKYFLFLDPWRSPLQYCMSGK